MPTKSNLQTILKDKYGINKNITAPLSVEDCEALLRVLQNQPSAVRLVESFTERNTELGNKNRYFGQQRSQAERRFQSLQEDHARLQKDIAELEQANAKLGGRKGMLSDEQHELKSQIQQLSERNQELSSKVQHLTTRNDQLVDANENLMKDNKDLKNIVDQIRLRLARDTKMLLEYEDSEIRKALIRLFRWTLG